MITLIPQYIYLFDNSGFCVEFFSRTAFKLPGLDGRWSVNFFVMPHLHGVFGLAAGPNQDQNQDQDQDRILQFHL
jgi:hypothetical protein